jgi:NodT family efflux transporter outer membrane factor (OMF) lipoprotein
MPGSAEALLSAAKHGTCALILGFALLAGCAVGPDYVRPDAPMADTFKEAGEWKVAEPSDTVLRGAWWEMFGDPQLNELAAQIDAGNFDLAAADARFRQAQALVGAARASYFPKVTIGIAAARARNSENLGGSRNVTGGSFSNYTLPLEIAWELDLWGRIRRTVESSRATAEATRADLASTRLSLQTALASNYFELRALDAERAILDATVAAYDRSLTLTQNRYEAGVVARADVAQAVTQVESTRAQSIDVAAQRAQLEHAIAVLVGIPPAYFSIPPAPLDGTPPTVPLALPSLLLERRPDIAAAARRVAAANAEIGVAYAAYYPAITLSAAGGFESSQFSSWFDWPSRFWSVGPAVSQTVYDGGLRKAQAENARAVYDETVANYRASVLTGGRRRARIGGTHHQPVQRRDGQLPRRGRVADARARQRTHRRGYSQPPHARERASDQGSRRRLERPRNREWGLREYPQMTQTQRRKEIPIS